MMKLEQQMSQAGVQRKMRSDLQGEREAIEDFEANGMNLNLGTDKKPLNETY